MVIHADNWFNFELMDFLRKREITRAKNCLITMITFNSQNPSEVGIVELREDGVVTNIFEKQDKKRGKKANGAIYIFEYEAVNWICRTDGIIDISTQVLPAFFDKILSHHTESYFRDIGIPKMLYQAQVDPLHVIGWDSTLYWRTNAKFQKVIQHVDSVVRSSRK